MPYQFQTVSFGIPPGTTITSGTDLGLPSTFPCALLSGWFTSPPDNGTWTFSGSSGRGLSLQWSTASAGFPHIAISIYGAAGGVTGQAISNLALEPGILTHVLLSVDAPGNRLQLYINDTDVSLSSAWINTNQMGGATDWRVGTGFNFGLACTQCAGDIWFSNQASFTDLATVSNRRKFINSDLSPVDLGPHGAAPFGTSPPMFLHLAPGALAAGFTANAGTGGAFSPDLGFGLCNVYPSYGVRRVLLPPAELQFCDADGHPFAGGTLEMYVVGTTTPKDTWKDAAGTILNTNPIVLDAAGRALIYGDGGYRTILRDADGNLIWDQPSFTYVSSAMAPVVGAATLADARHAMGIDDAIQVETDRALAAEAAEVIARDAAIAVETARAEAAEAAETAARIAADAVLQAEIDGLPPAVPPFQAASNHVGADGHVRVTYPVAFAVGHTSAVVVTAIETGFVSVTCSVNSDRFGFDIWIMRAGSPIAAANTSFNWFATQD